MFDLSEWSETRTLDTVRRGDNELTAEAHHVDELVI